MKRLTLSLLLGVFCLVLLAVPANAGLYDPHNPPPTPYININDDLSNSEIGWDGTTQSYVVDHTIDLPTVDPSEDANILNSNTATGEDQIRSVIKKVILSVFVPMVFGW